MSDITRILEQIEGGDQHAAEDLLPLIYDELRSLAAARMASERPDHTLSATALVHEAYVRLVDTDRVQNWDSRGHFFAAAAEAMRRILVDRARKRQRLKRGGDRVKLELLENLVMTTDTPDQVIAISDALDRLTQEDPLPARVFSLRVFANVPISEIASTMGISRANAYRQWTYARAWIRSELLETN